MRVVYVQFLLGCTVILGAKWYKFFDDKIHYQISYYSKEQQKTDEFGDQTLVDIKTVNNEGYQCAMPDMEFSVDKQVYEYKGPSPNKLLQRLYHERRCSIRMEPYWMYEICHGVSIRQFYEDKKLKSRTEFVLGYYSHDPWLTSEPIYDQLNPPSLEYIGTKYPYHQMIYSGGSTCDLTGRPRRVLVKYICVESHPTLFLTLNEVQTCNYEVVVGTSYLCEHPAFRPISNIKLEIKCYMEKEFVNKNSKVLPKKYEQFIKDRQFDDFEEVISKNVKGFIRKVPASASAPQTEFHTHAEEPPILTTENSQLPMPTFYDVTAFLFERRCMFGVDNAETKWSFQICYKNKILAYVTDEIDKKTSRVLLGVFKEQEHKSWAKKNPQKVRVIDKLMNNVVIVTNFYTSGDLCGVELVPRSVELRFKCKNDEKMREKAPITMNLKLVNSCHSILTVESLLFCPYLQNTDEYGIYQPELFFKLSAKTL